MWSCILSQCGEAKVNINCLCRHLTHTLRSTAALQHCSTAAAAHPRLAVLHNTTHISIAVLGGLSYCGPSFSHYTPITSYLGWWYCFCLSHTLQRNTWHHQPAALRRSPHKKPATALLSRARNDNISQSRRRPSWFKGPLTTHFAKQAWTWYCRCVDVKYGDADSKIIRDWLVAVRIYANQTILWSLWSLMSTYHV